MQKGYKDIVRFLRERIEGKDLAPGTQLPTQAELEARFKVSAKTVKMAIRELVHEGLVTSRRGKGAFVAERVPQQERVLFLMPHLGVGDVFQEIFVCCEKAFVGQFQTVYASTENDYAHAERQIRFLAPDGYRAIVFVPLAGTDAVFNPQLVAALLERSPHLLLLDRGIEGESLPVVRFDNRGAAKKLGALLRAARYDSYIFAFGIESETVEERWEGFQESLCERRQAKSEKWSLARGFDDKAGLLVERVRKGERVGLFAVNEQIAHRIYLRLQREGVDVPKQVGLATFGDSLRLGVRMTTARPCIERIPAALGAMLDKGELRSLQVPVEILPGQTTSAG